MESLLEEIIGYTRDSALTCDVFIREYVLEKIRAAAKCGQTSYYIRAYFVIHAYSKCACDGSYYHCKEGCIEVGRTDIDKIASYLKTNGFKVVQVGGGDYTVSWMPEEDKQHERR